MGIKWKVFEVNYQAAPPNEKCVFWIEGGAWSDFHLNPFTASSHELLQSAILHMTNYS